MRRAKWGIGAVVVVGLAWFLSNFFNIRLGGVGSDEGTQIGLPTQTSVAEREKTPTEPPDQTEPIPDEGSETVSLTETGDAIGTSGAIDVLIDDRMFYVRRGTGEEATWVAAEPEVIVSYVQQAPGDETGVRVRIFRRPSALASAEKELSDSLQAAGVPASQIDVREQLLESE